MRGELGSLIHTAHQFLSTDPAAHRYSNIETNRDCNRNCSYCLVPTRYDRERELGVEETCQQVDWLVDNGYPILSYIGGEPLAPALPNGKFVTKEGLSFREQTLRVVDYAKGKGMMVNVTSNGDYVDQDTIKALRKVGLDTLSFSLHTYTRKGLDHLIERARMAAEEGIIPTIQTVLTNTRAADFPGIAAHVAENGILFGFGIVQEKGGPFSRAQEHTLVPTVEQQQEVFRAMLRLKTFGMIRNGRRYMTDAPDYPNNSWTCNPETDTFIHIGPGGNLDVCSDVRTDIKTADVQLLSADQQWRDIKRVRVQHCGNCLYHCCYEMEHPDPRGDLATVGVMMLIKSGHAKMAERWGQFAVERSKELESNIDWELHLK